MLSPMPLALTLGLGGTQARTFYAAAIENTNGQAITLHNRHRGVRNARDMRGFRFCVPFPYSMHNYLLRYFLAEAGLHPDRDVDIRYVPPPEMVANLRAGNVDGYLGPDPFNQRAVYDGIGFLYMLSRDIWDGHPCCALAVSKDFVETCPNSFAALFKSIVDATHYASRPENRSEIAQAISPANYLNQPRDLLEHVLTGRFPDGLGNNRVVANRINFDPFPWHSMAVWILTQMKRWNQIPGDVDYKRVAEEVYRAADCDRVARELGYPAHENTYTRHTILGASFDADRAEEYVNSFAIHNREPAPQQAQPQSEAAPPGFPGPTQIADRAIQEFSDPFHKRGTNDHGIGWLTLYTVGRFAAGFVAASVVAITLGIAIGLSNWLYRILNPIIQILKPISPLAWMPILLFTVEDSGWCSILVVFLASLWPTMANTAFGVHAIRKEYVQVGGMLQLPWWRRIFLIVLPAAAPATVAGLRISFGSALIAVVPAEMLLGVLGVGYMSWNHWNNNDIAGVIFCILVVGVIGFCLDLAFNQLSKRVTYSE
jgi:nitrate/nitrite transport system substrate-binding protein